MCDRKCIRRLTVNHHLKRPQHQYELFRAAKFREKSPETRATDRVERICKINECDVKRLVLFGWFLLQLRFLGSRVHLNILLTRKLGSSQCCLAKEARSISVLSCQGSQVHLTVVLTKKPGPSQCCLDAEAGSISVLSCQGSRVHLNIILTRKLGSSHCCLAKEARSISVLSCQGSQVHLSVVLTRKPGPSHCCLDKEAGSISVLS